MRLNPFNPDNVKVRRTSDRRKLFPGGGGGKVGCGTIAIAIIAMLVMGADPAQMFGEIEGRGQMAVHQKTGTNETAEQICDDNQYALESCNALGSLNETWAPIFERANLTFETPYLVFPESNNFDTDCGLTTVGMGPFYCPANQSIYIDTRFYDQMERQMGAGGDFARYYVIAHEYGHHIQTVTGITDQIRSAQSQIPRAANQLQILMELQADCYAGLWAAKNRNLIESGDLVEGLRAASAIGDDTLQRRVGEQVTPESFTHGTSKQRTEALLLGLQGDDTQCDDITRR